MKYNLKTLKLNKEDKKNYTNESLDSFVIANSDLGGEFLLSSSWKKVLDLDDCKYDILKVIDDKQNILAVLFINYQKSLFFNYGYLARGPIFSKELSDNEKIIVFNFLINELKHRKESFSFLRFETFNGFRDLYNLNNINKIKKVKDIQPRKTLVLDLLKNEDELLKEMHQKTRYNINLARRKGVEIFVAKDKKEYFNDFWRLMKLTGERDSFGIHNTKHYLNILLADDNFKLYLAKIDNNIITAGIFSFFGKRVTYLHGASDNSYRKAMAPHLLQFNVISDAKKAGFNYYDFYGIDEEKWPGVTRFKKGFNGFEFLYDGTCDYVFCKYKYSLYLFLKKIKSIF